MGAAIMITAANFLTWCEVFGVPTGQGGGSGAVTERQVQQSAFNFAETTGSNDSFVVTLSPAVLTLTDGLIVTMNSGSLSNTSDSPTLQVDALPAKTITLWGGLPLLPSDITSNTVYLFLYDLSDDTFQLINPSISTANTTLVQANTYNAAIDTGVANAYVITLTPAPQGDFSEGFAIYFRATHTNTGASTITVNGVEKAITLQGGSALPASVMSANGTYFCLYSTSLGNWILMNPAGSVVGVTSGQGTEYQVLVNDTFGELQEGALTFTLPQDIAPTSSPEFASATIGTAIIGTPDSFNLQIGLNTLSAIEFVGYSIAIGANAFANLAYAQDCVAIGYNAGTLLVGSDDNLCAYTTFIGSFAGSASTFAYASTFVGYGAGGNATTGSENSIFGANAGAGIIAGSYNTLLGAGTDVSADGSGMLAIGITAIADPATGSSSSDYGPGIAIGSSVAPVGFRGDGTAFPAGTGAVYWRTKINSTYYNIPLLTDGTDLQWPGTSGTIALVGEMPSNNYVSDIVTSDSPTAISSETPKSICTLTLAAGNWMVGGNGAGVATGLINALVVGVSTIENAFNGDLSGPDASYPMGLINGLYVSGASVVTQISAGESAFTLTETTTFYLTIQYNTNGAPGTAFGILYAYNYEP